MSIHPAWLLFVIPSLVFGQVDQSGCISVEIPSPVESRRALAFESTVWEQKDRPATIIDLLVVYTANVRDYYGSTQDAEALIRATVEKVNLILSRSQIAVQFRVVLVMDTDMIEDPTLGADYIHLLRDKMIDPNHAISKARDRFRADLVSLWVSDLGPEAAGVAYRLMSLDDTWESYGCNVIDARSGSLEIILAHELGHNLGCAHDVATTPSSEPFQYSHGYILQLPEFGAVRGPIGVEGGARSALQNQTAEPIDSVLTHEPNNWVRTIMAYSDDCFEELSSCPVVPYFSNPRLFYVHESNPTPALPLGDPAVADNARTIEQTAPHVASYR